MRISRLCHALLLTVLMSACKPEGTPTEDSSDQVDLGPVPFVIEKAILPLNFWTGKPGGSEGLAFTTVEISIRTRKAVFFVWSSVSAEPECRATREVDLLRMQKVARELQALRRCERKGPIPDCAAFVPEVEYGVEGESQKFPFGNVCSGQGFCDPVRAVRIGEDLLDLVLQGPSNPCDP